MPQEKQSLSPMERKSVTDYVIELSQRAAQAVSSAQALQGENGNGTGAKREND